MGVSGGRHVPLEDDEHESVSMKMEIYGEASNFSFGRGYFIDSVSRKTALLPDGWQDRVVRFRTHAPVGTKRPSRRTGLCLEKHDICASKLARGWEKDITFTSMLVSNGLVDGDLLLERVGAIPTERFESPEQKDAALARARAFASRPGEQDNREQCQ